MKAIRNTLHHDHRQTESDGRFSDEKNQSQDDAKPQDRSEDARHTNKNDKKTNTSQQDLGAESSLAQEVVQTFEGRSDETRTVRDPITHQLLENVKDVTEKQYEGAMYEAGEIKKQVPRSGGNAKSKAWAAASQEGEDRGQDEQKDQTSRSAMSALPAFPYDDPRQPRYQAALQSAGPKIAKATHWLVAIWTLVFALIFRDIYTIGVFLVSSATLAYFLPHLAQRRFRDALEEADAAHEEHRGQQIENAHWPESADWLNKLLGEIWPAIQPEMFDSLRDTLEDLLQANVPSFLSEVKVASFTQGGNPLRILSATLLPDTEWDGEESPDESDDKDKDELTSEVRDARQEGFVELDPEAAMLKEKRDPNDRYVNLSVTFAYRGREKQKKPRKGEREQLAVAADAQMLLHLVARLGPAAVKFPVKCHLRGLVGTVRLRIHLISAPPFLGQTLLSFTSLPRISIDVVPLKLISLNDIKPLESFIQNSIDSAFASFTAPKSIRLDIASLMMSDGVQRKVEAVGVIVVTIHRVEGLSKADVFGKSDPYAIISWARSGKPMFSTRVVLKELNPRFEESVALLVPPQVVKAEERIGLEIFDSDIGSDDMLGEATMDLKELLERPGEAIHRSEQLGGARPGSKRPGTVHWSARFLKKATLKEDSASERARREAQESNKTEAEQEADADPNEANEEDKLPVERLPPSPGLPSGILSLQVHEIAALSNQTNLSSSAAGSTAKLSRRTPITGRTLPDEETMDDLALDEAPSSYVEVLVEDKLVYRTRTKISDYRPIFNALTEKVVLDWRTARVTLVVREKKLDEEDPILGIVPLKLREVFESKSLISSWYPIAGGCGSGRIKVSLLFRSLERPQDDDQSSKDSLAAASSTQELPKGSPICPLETGVVRVSNLEIKSNDDQVNLSSKWSPLTLKLRTIGSRAKLASRHSDELSNNENGLTYERRLSQQPLYIPIFRRGASVFSMELSSKDKLTGKSKTQFIGVLWLRDLDAGNEGEEQTITVPLWLPEDKESLQFLRQQYVPTLGQHNNEDSSPQAILKEAGVQARQVGSMTVSLAFLAGVTSLHGRIEDPSGMLGHVSRVWKLAVAKGLVTEGDDYKRRQKGQRQQDDDDDDEAEAADREEKKLAPQTLSEGGDGDDDDNNSSSSSSDSEVDSDDHHTSLTDNQGLLHGGEEGDENGDIKPLRMLDSGFEGLKGKAQGLMNKLDVKKKQKSGGEGVESEV